LRHRQTDPDRRLDEVPVDAEEDDDDRAPREDGELRRMPIFAHATVATFPVRRYSRKLMNVVRIRMFTAVFLADMTPR
jgi:hypothetical protein